MSEEEYEYSDNDNWLEINILVPLGIEDSGEYTEKRGMVWKENIVGIFPTTFEHDHDRWGTILNMENGDSYSCIDSYEDILLRIGLADFVR